MEMPPMNIGDLAKPVTTLIKKISDAIGVIYEPTQIVRKAKAEARAAEILAVSRENISAIEQRTVGRLLVTERRQQENIETIIEKAIPEVAATAQSDKIDDDWLVQFFEKAKLVSDEEMQSLWGKILAGQANIPGSFSRRTLRFVSELDKKDADLFTSLCKFNFQIYKNTIVVFDTDNSFYHRYSINFSSLKHLDQIGLLEFDNLAGFNRLHLPQEMAIFYFGQPVLFRFPQPMDNTLPFGKILLSQIGEELAPICGATPDEEIRRFTAEEWRKQGVDVILP